MPEMERVLQWGSVVRGYVGKFDDIGLNGVRPVALDCYGGKERLAMTVQGVILNEALYQAGAHDRLSAGRTNTRYPRGVAPASRW
jgi:hypothetical protein